MGKNYKDKEILDIVKPFSRAKSMQDDELTEVYHVAQKIEDGIILEIGSYRGVSTIALAKGNNGKNKLVTVDPFIAHGEVDANKTTFWSYIERAGVKEHITQIQDFSTNITIDDKIALLLIDGDHSYEGVKHDFEKFGPKVKKGGYIVMHDYHLPGIKKFFEESIYPNKKQYQEFRIIADLIVLRV